MNTAQKDLYIEYLEKSGNESEARRYAGVRATAVRKALNDDPDFEEQVLECKSRIADMLEQEAFHRAVNGTVKNVYYKGEIVGEQTEYSDSLLMFLLKGNKPEKYGDKTTLMGSKSEPLTIEVIDVLGEKETLKAEAVRSVVGSMMENIQPTGFIDTNSGDDLV